MRCFDFSIPTRFVFGAGRVADLGQLVDPSIERVLVVTDTGVVRNTPALQTVRAQLGDRVCGVFDKVEANPSFETIEYAAAMARERRIQLVLGLGGGSPMDAAKGVALLAVNPEGIAILKAGLPPTTEPMPVVCIPTTAGTGSEVTPFVVFTEETEHSKIGYGHASLYPILALVDPDLSATMPDAVRIDTGLDALTHAIEAYLSTEASPLSDLFAIEAIKTVLGVLPAAVDHDQEAIASMAYAASLGGIAIAHAGTTLLHVMGYPLTSFHDVPHGRASVCLLPYYLAFLKKSGRRAERIRSIERWFSGVGGVSTFLHRLGVSTRIADYGVENCEIPTYVEKVIIKGDLRITPANVEREDIGGIYMASLRSAG